MSEEVSKFLCYGLIDPRNGELRYVGKSAQGMARPHKHQTGAGRKNGGHCQAWLRQLWSDGGQVPSILILRHCNTDAQALAYEVLYIAMFREAGFDLTNLTDGGDGGPGHKVSPEARARIGAGNRGKVRTPETLAKMSLVTSNPSAEWSAKISAANRRRVVSPETRMKLSISHKGLVRSPEHCAKISENNKRRSAATHAKMSDGQRARWQRFREARAMPDNNQKQETTT